MNRKHQLQVFSKAELGSIRTVGEGKDALFCLLDVARCLEYKDAGKSVCDHCMCTEFMPIPTEGGVQKVRFGKVSEVFRLIMKSRCKKAQKFQDWVCEEVLPSIMETGSYSVMQCEQRNFNGEVVEAMTETRKVISYLDGGLTELRNISAEMDDRVNDIEKRIESLECHKEHGVKHEKYEEKPLPETKTLVISTYPSSLSWISNILRGLNLSWTMEPKNEGTVYDIIIQEVISCDRAEVINRISFRKPNYKKYITIKTL